MVFLLVNFIFNFSLIYGLRRFSEEIRYHLILVINYAIIVSSIALTSPFLYYDDLFAQASGFLLSIAFFNMGLFLFRIIIFYKYEQISDLTHHLFFLTIGFLLYFNHCFLVILVMLGLQQVTSVIYHSFLISVQIDRHQKVLYLLNLFIFVIFRLIFTPLVALYGINWLLSVYDSFSFNLILLLVALSGAILTNLIYLIMVIQDWKRRWPLLQKG